MIRLLIVLIVIIFILLILKSRKTSGSLSKKNYNKIIFGIIIIGFIFFLATSGKFLIPQILNVIKVAIPFLTKFIAI